MSRQQEQTKKRTTSASTSTDARKNLIDSKTTVQSSQDKEYSDQEVKDLLYKKTMDKMKKKLVWNEDAQMFFHENENGIYDGQFTVAELRKSVKDQTEKLATPEYIKTFKERNKKKTEFKRNRQRITSQRNSSYQNINDKLETTRQLGEGIEKRQDKIGKIKEDILKLDKEMLEHKKYVYKLESKAAEQQMVSGQNRVENYLALERDRDTATYRIDTQISKEKEINIQIQQIEQQQQQHRESMIQGQRQHSDLMDQQNLARAQAAQISQDMIKQQNDIARQQANTAAQYLQQQAEQSAKMDQGFADVTAAIRNGAIASSAAMNALATQQAESAAQAQAKWDQSQRASDAANLTDPVKIQQLCGGSCPQNFSWKVFKRNVTNIRTGQKGITVWQCSGGGHFCASDEGDLNTGPSGRANLTNYEDMHRNTLQQSGYGYTGSGYRYGSRYGY